MKLTVNAVFSRFYREEVVAGYNNAGWPVVKAAKYIGTSMYDDAPIAGGICSSESRTIPPELLEILAKQAALVAALAELSDYLDERDRWDQENSDPD